MQVKDVMTHNRMPIHTDSTLREATGMMRDLNLGALPVCENRRLVGILTNRNIALHCSDHDLRKVKVREAMTPGVFYCFEDQDVAEAGRLMLHKHVHRLVVLNRDKRLVGLVSLRRLVREDRQQLSAEENSSAERSQSRATTSAATEPGESASGEPAAPRVTLAVAEGDLPEREYVFAEPAHCVVGRADDCTIQLPKSSIHAGVSRHHCLLDIDPPVVRVRDLDSLNGTYVNGEKIGQRPRDQESPDPERAAAGERDLKEGDELRVGHTVFRVAVRAPLA
jgi:CBS domain-containing protein/pSer/pThr/pTyr-binding forkhead associated (FHA) protein